MQSVASLLSTGAAELASQFSRTPSEQNVSAGHCEHGPPTEPEYPSLQMQSVCAELPAGEL
eukprot:1541780-Rhodomonas_salina.1